MAHSTAEYKGYTIVRNEQGYWLSRAAMTFDTLEEATDYIDWS